MYREFIFPIWSKEGIEQGQFGEGKGGKSLPSASIFDTFEKATVPNKPLDGQIPCLSVSGNHYPQESLWATVAFSAD